MTAEEKERLEVFAELDRLFDSITDGVIRLAEQVNEARPEYNLEEGSSRAD